MSQEAFRDAEAGRFIDPGSPLRPHYEEVARRLLSPEGRSRIAVVTAPEKGAGRSSLCLGLGSAVAGMGLRAAVVDCNPARPHLHRLLGEPNFVGLSSALQGDRPLEHYGHEVLPGLLVVPGGPQPEGRLAVLESERLVGAVRDLAEGYDLVLLDSPLIERVLASKTLSHAFDGVLLVMHASRTSRRTAREATGILLDAGVRVLGVVFNRYVSDPQTVASG